MQILSALLLSHYCLMKVVGLVERIDWLQKCIILSLSSLIGVCHRGVVKLKIKHFPLTEIKYIY